METKKITVKQALDEGYSQYGFEGEPFYHEIEDIDSDDEFPIGATLVNKDSSYSLTILAESIRELVIEHLIDNQEEVYDEHGFLRGLASEADFESLAKDINNRLSKIKYSDLTDIELIP